MDIFLTNKITITAPQLTVIVCCTPLYEFKIYFQASNKKNILHVTNTIQKKSQNINTVLFELCKKIVHG